MIQGGGKISFYSKGGGGGGGGGGSYIHVHIEVYQGEGARFDQGGECPLVPSPLNEPLITHEGFTMFSPDGQCDAHI